MGIGGKEVAMVHKEKIAFSDALVSNNHLNYIIILGY